jgi:hypothetical protein
MADDTDTQVSRRIELMARYLTAAGWQIWMETDPALDRLRDVHRAAYEQNRHLGYSPATHAAFVALLREVFGDQQH